MAVEERRMWLEQAMMEKGSQKSEGNEVNENGYSWLEREGVLVKEEVTEKAEVIVCSRRLPDLD